jgi:hypothetical protein
MEPCMTLPLYSEEFPEFHHSWVNSFILSFEECHLTFSIALITTDRDSINGLFWLLQKNRWKQCSFDSLWPTRGSRHSKHGIISLSRRAALLQNCGEDDAKTGKMLGRMDPVLKCYPNCPQMITFNQDVLRAEANGSCSRLYSSHMLISLSTLQVPRLKQWQHQ